MRFSWKRKTLTTKCFLEARIRRPGENERAFFDVQRESRTQRGAKIKD
jgi:hypothetical protein